MNEKKQLTAMFDLTEKDIDAALKKDAIELNGVYYEVPTEQLKMYKKNGRSGKLGFTLTEMAIPEDDNPN